MNNNVKLRILLLLVVLPAALAVGGEHLKTQIKGSLKNDLYTSVEKDFRVRVPVHDSTGGAVRDESGRRGSNSISQVIFTDDFGAFYRVVSMQTDYKMDDVLNVFRDIRSKEEGEGKWGRELHVINVEKEGAELSVTTIEPGSGPQTKRPDMVTASLIFSANNRIYHLLAGTPVFAQQTVDGATARARSDLAGLVSGFELIEESKSRK
jgi:hypothetical protein